MPFSSSSRAGAPDALRLYRKLLGLIAAGNLAFAVAHRADGAAVVDPLWLRLTVSGLAVAIAIWTTRPGASVRLARALLYGAAYALVVNATLACVWNGFAPSYAVGYLALVAALGLGGAATSRTANTLQGVMAAAVVAALGGLALTDVPGIGRAAFVLSLFATATVAVAVTRERARAQARFVGEQARYRSVFDRATDGIYLVNAASRRVLDANPAMLRLTGYTLAEIRARRVDDLIDVAPGETAVGDNVAEALARREIVVGPRRLRRRDGRIVDVEVTATVIDVGDGADTMSVVVRDATERRLAERALREAAAEAEAARARAEELLRLKTSFLSNMSHEIRTPLTAILGYSDLLADEVSGDASEMVAVITRGATRLMGTLNSVLDLARLEADGCAPEARPVDLADEAAATLAALRPLAEARGLDLHFGSATAAVWASAEPGAVARILDNLVGNAIKFTTVGGVSVTVARDADRAFVSVADTGPGIPEAFRPKLFAEFEQASSGHARTHEGSGLGLAITQRLVERLGGTIEVESEVGRGTTFTVALPACAPAAAVPA